MTDTYTCKQCGETFRDEGVTVCEECYRAMMAPRSNRHEHLAWAKQRALQYLDAGDLADAFASMASDLSKYPELRGIGNKIFPLGMLAVMNHDARELRRWIEGFR